MPLHSYREFCVCLMIVCYALLGEMCYLSLLLPLLERLFGVKGHDCCLSCLAFRNYCRRVLLGDLFFEGWLRQVLCVCMTSVDFVCFVWGVV